MKRLLALGSTKRRSLLAVGILALAVAGVAIADYVEQSRQASIYESYAKNGFADLSALVEHFRNAQSERIPLVPPGMPYCIFSGGKRLVSWESLPNVFVKGLVGVPQGNAIVYPVTVYEDARTRDYVFLNADGQEICSVAAPRDHDACWIVLARFPHLYTSGRSRQEIEALIEQYDSSRVVLEYELAGADAVAELAAAQAVARVPLDPPMMLMGGGPTISNILFTAIEKISNDWTEVEISYPTTYTNRIDIFSVDSGTGLLDFWWELRETTNVNTSTNYITWVDTDATNATGDIRFYAAANADLNDDTDEDDDNLTWGREHFVYHTSPTNSDSDADGYSDYAEVITMKTDPNNDDTTSPSVSIDLPTNNTERIWLP